MPYHRESSIALLEALRDCGSGAFDLSHCRELLACGANPNVLDPMGRTPLMWAAIEGNPQAAVMLAPLSELSFIDQDGRGALHLACSHGHAAAALALLPFFNPRSPDRFGQTPIAIATQAGLLDLAQSLSKKI